MTILSITLLTVITILAGLVLLRYRWYQFLIWESSILATHHNLPLKTAQQIVQGQQELTEADNEVWNLAQKYGIDFQTALKVRDRQIDIQQYLKQQRDQYLSQQTTSPNQKTLFPFKMNPMYSGLDLNVQELRSEPKAYINASLASAWFYGVGAQNSHIVLSGHANGPVCSQVSALLMNTYLSLDDTEDTLLVPGACMLRGPVGMSELSIKTPDPKVKVKGKRISLSQLLRPSETPWQKLPGNLKPLENDTGLVQTQRTNKLTYWQIREQIISQIKQAQASLSSQDTLLRGSNTAKEPQLMFMPFFSLNNDNLDTVEFEVPFRLFESEDFVYLREVHQRIILIEMTGDALRRKGVYEEWLATHEKSYESYGRYYESLTPEQRQQKTAEYGVEIKYTLDYVTGTKVPIDPNQPKRYISPEEQYTKNLPSLIESDKKWIADMEKLIGDINKRDRFRDDRLEEINIAILIDSFLRGWPSAFLRGKEGKERYDNWCEQKREEAWQYLHRQLETRQMRLEPLLEQNTIFQVQSVDRQTLRLKPLHVTTTHDILVYLSPNYGLTYYINAWQRRDIKHLPTSAQQNNLARAKTHYNQGVQWLDASSANTQAGIEAMRQALKYHPLYTTQQLWNDWWSRFGKDTSQAFEIFSYMIRGLQAYENAEYQDSIASFKRFVTHYPRYLADPYVLLVWQELLIEYNLVSLRKKRHTLQEKQTKLLALYKEKMGFLDSNKGLIERIQAKTLLKTDRQLQIEEVINVFKEKPQLEKELTDLKTQLEQLGEQIIQDEQQIWNRLNTMEHHYLTQARLIDPDYVVKVLKEQKLQTSKNYAQRFQSLREVLEADEYTQIAENLAKLSTDLRKDNSTDSSMDEAEQLAKPLAELRTDEELIVEKIRETIEACLQVNYIKKTDLTALQEFKDKKVVNFHKIDSIIRELVLKQDLDQLSQDYFKRGVLQYEAPARYLVEFTDPLKRVITLYSLYRSQYHKAVQRMITESVALRNFAPQATVTQLDYSTFDIKKVWFDPSDKLIVAHDTQGQEIKLAQIDGLSEEESHHLQQEISKEDFTQRLFLGVTTAEKVLNRTITPAPKAQRWCEMLQTLEPLLIKVIAYGGRPPIPNQPLPDDETMQKLEQKPPIDTVEYDFETVQQKFLAEIGIEPSKVTVVTI